MASGSASKGDVSTASYWRRLWVRRKVALGAWFLSGVSTSLALSLLRIRREAREAKEELTAARQQLATAREKEKEARDKLLLMRQELLEELQGGGGGRSGRRSAANDNLERIVRKYDNAVTESAKANANANSKAAEHKAKVMV